MFSIISTVNFGFRYDIDHVTISPSTGFAATSAGERDYTCRLGPGILENSAMVIVNGICINMAVCVIDLECYMH